MRRIFEPKRKKVTGGWKKHMRGLHNLHSSPNLTSMIKLRRMQWAEHIACMERFGQKA
jgi:hypothetical protein